MPFTFVLPDQYGYVLLAAGTSFILNTVHGFNVSMYRKPSGVKYPNAYGTREEADKDPKVFAFNCAQRAHANFIENQPSFLGALLLGGLSFPVIAASLGGIWAVGRIAYMVGYTNPKSGPRGRVTGSMVATLCQLGLIGCTIYTGITMIMGS